MISRNLIVFFWFSLLLFLVPRCVGQNTEFKDFWTKKHSLSEKKLSRGEYTAVATITQIGRERSKKFDVFHMLVCGSEFKNTLFNPPSEDNFSELAENSDAAYLNLSIRRVMIGNSKYRATLDLTPENEYRLSFFLETEEAILENNWLQTSFKFTDMGISWLDLVNHENVVDVSWNSEDEKGKGILKINASDLPNAPGNSSIKAVFRLSDGLCLKQELAGIMAPNTQVEIHREYEYGRVDNPEIPNRIVESMYVGGSLIETKDIMILGLNLGPDCTKSQFLVSGYGFPEPTTKSEISSIWRILPIIVICFVLFFVFYIVVIKK